MITLLVCGPDLTASMDPIINWASVKAEIRHNEVGAGQFTCPTTPALLSATTTPRSRVMLIRDGSVFSTGPVEKPSSYEWTAGAGSGLTTVQWADDLLCVAGGIAYPDPTVAADAQILDAYEQTATNAETIILDLVNRNVGPGALAARRYPNLVMATPLGVGTTVDATERFTQLGDAIRALCVAGGNLGVRVVQRAGQLVFEVFAPVDRSGTVRFSPGLNNLLSLKIDHDAPAATVAIVGGTGTGALREIVERIDATAATWGRSETFVSSTATTTIGLEQAGDLALVEKGEKLTVTAVAVDTADQRFGSAFFLGDTVTIVSPAGTAITDVVTAATLTATPTDGDRVTLAIGSAHTAGWDPTSLRLRNLERRLSEIERR